MMDSINTSVWWSAHKFYDNFQYLMMTAYIERDESGTRKVHDAREKLESLSTVDIIAIPRTCI